MDAVARAEVVGEPNVSLQVWVPLHHHQIVLLLENVDVSSNWRLPHPAYQGRRDPLRRRHRNVRLQHRETDERQHSKQASVSYTSGYTS